MLPLFTLALPLSPPPSPLPLSPPPPPPFLSLLLLSPPSLFSSLPPPPLPCPSPQQQRPQSRPGSDLKAVLSKQDTTTSSPADTLKTRDRSPLVERQRISPVQTVHVASHVRERSNSINHDHIRSIKYEVAKLREHLLKVEEEIKNLNRGRHMLELAIQDIRKALSVNQQSLSTQQKKTRSSEVGDGVPSLFLRLLATYSVQHLGDFWVLSSCKSN